VLRFVFLSLSKTVAKVLLFFILTKFFFKKSFMENRK